MQESRLNVSKRKASDSGVTAAESTAAPADDPSPPKRMKASTDVTAEQVCVFVWGAKPLFCPLCSSPSPNWRSLEQLAWLLHQERSAGDPAFR